MYRVYLTNFGYYVDGEYSTITEARTRGHRTGFEFTIWKIGSVDIDLSFVQIEDVLVASYSIFGGFRLEHHA
jgi:hypothetical protein